MTEIDERIIAAHWDGKDFEKGAKQAISTLEKLKESFNFEGSADSLSDLASSIKEIDFGDSASKAEKLGNALKSIPKALGKAAFSPIAKMGSALSSLANQVKTWFGIDLARDIEKSLTGAVKALTVEPIKMGWDEYEMKMDSIKTIMTGTADEFAGLSDDEHMGKVKETLEELNHYADETIYSFKDMTANIGKFTNAGVHLDVAARSMMGISNLAAKAGQGTQQASMAMYNFSQSMGLGYVELRDWRSIENANMATLEFKDTLIDVGVALGTLQKDSKGVITTNVKGEKKVAVTAKNLRETLQKKWLTSDVLEKTLEIYSGNLGEKELKAMGNFTDEQIAAFLKIGAEAKEAATQVRTFSKMWDALREAAQSGWAVSFEKIIGDMNEATEFWSGINKRISGWLDTSADHRNAILNQWRGLTGDGELRISEIDGRQEMINSLHNILTIIENISGAIKGAIASVFGELTGSQLRDWSVRFREFTDNVVAWLGSMDDGNSRLSKLSRALKGPLSIIKAVIKVLKTVGGIMIDMIFPFFDPIINFFELVGETISDILEGNFSFEKLGNQLMGIGTSIVGAGVNIWENIKKWFNKLFKKDDSTIKKPIGEWFSGIGTAFNEWINRIKNFIHWDELKQWFANVFDQVVTFFLGEKAWRMTTGENVRKKSQFTKLFESLAEGFNTGLTNFKSLVHWEDIKATAASIFDNIKTWFIGEEKEDRLTGEKVKTKSSFQIAVDNIVAAVSSFITTASSWEGWTVFGDFCTSIYNSIVDFCTPKEDGSPSKLKETFDSIVGKVNEFINTVKSWGIWDILDEHLIQPFRKLWNLIFHGDADYDEKKTKAFAPIGVIAAGMASDRPLLKKEEKENQNIFKSIASGLSESLQEILNAFHIFSADEEGKFDPIGRFNEWASNLGTRISEAWAPVGENIQTIAADISSTATTLQEAVGKIVAWIVESPWEEWFHDINDRLRELGGTFAIFEGGSLLGGLGKSANGLGRFLYSLAGINKEIKKNGGLKFKFNFGDVGEGLKNLFTDTGKAFKVLGKNAAGWLKNPKDLGKKFGQIFGGFREGQVTSTERVQTFANVLIELGIAVGAMAWAITSLIDKVKEINELDIDGTTKKSDAIYERLNGLFIAIGSALGVTEILATVNAFGHEKGTALASSLFGFAGAVAAMTWAITSLVELCKAATPEQLLAAEAIIVSFAGIITAFSWTNNKSSEWLGTTDKNGFWKAGKSSSGGLIGFAVAIEAMVLALNQLVGTVKNTEFGEVQEAILILTELSTLITAFDFVKNFSQKFVGEKTSGSGLVGFALAIEAMIHAVRSIAEVTKDEKVDMAQVQLTLAELGGLISTFELFKNLSSFKIGNVQVGGGNSKTGLVGFAIAIAEMVNAVKRLSSLPKENLEQGTAALDQISGFIDKFMLLKDAGQLLGSAFNAGDKFGYKGGSNKTGLLGFVAAITALLAEVVIVGNLPEDGVQNGLNIMNSITNMVSEFQALASLENLSEHFGSVGQKVTAAVSMGLFIAGLAGILWAIAELSKTTTPDQVSAFTDVLKELWPSLATFETFITAMSVIPNGSGWLGGAKAAVAILEFIAIMAASAYGLNEWQKADPELFKSVEEGLTGIGKLIGLFTGTVQGTHQGAALVTLSSRLNDIEMIDLSKLENMSAAVDLVKKMSENLPTDPTILEKWFQGKMSLGDFAINMANLGDGLRSFNNAISGANFLGEISEGEVLRPENFQKAGIAIEAILSVLKDFKDYGLEGNDLWDLKYFLETIGDDQLSFIGNDSMLVQFAKLGEAFASSWNNISFDKDINAAPFVESLALAIESASTQERFKLALITSLQGAIDGMGDMALSLSKKGSEVVTGMTDNMSQTVEEAAPEIAGTMDAWVNSFLGTLLPEMTEGGTEATNNLAEGAKTGASKMQDAGYYADLGLAKGIGEYAYLPQDAMSSVCDLVYGAAQNKFQFNSPSKLFAEVGKYNMQGLALGTTDNEELAISAVQRMGDNYYLAMQQALAPIDAIINDDFSISPVITPVVDMSNVRNGASMVDGLFGARYGFNSPVPSFVRNITVPEVRNTPVNNSQVIDAITSRMDVMSEELRNLKIVLNTGALVGQTVSEYDRVLGRRAAQARRG